MYNNIIKKITDNQQISQKTLEEKTKYLYNNNTKNIINKTNITNKNNNDEIAIIKNAIENNINIHKKNP